MGTLSLVVRGIVFVIGVPFLLIGLGFLLLSGAVAWDDYQATQGIASAEGTIQSSSLEEATATEGTTETVYYPRVQYTYEVDGRTYNGRLIYSPNDRSSTSELEGKEYEDITKAQSDVREYRQGETVTVYYYEGNPGEPFLERPTIDWGGAIVFAVFFAGIPLTIGVALSGGALFFGRIRSRLGGGGDETTVEAGDPGVDAEHYDEEDDDGWGDDGGGGGWGGDGGGGGGGE